MVAEQGACCSRRVPGEVESHGAESGYGFGRETLENSSTSCSSSTAALPGACWVSSLPKGKAIPSLHRYFSSDFLNRGGSSWASSSIGAEAEARSMQNWIESWCWI